MRSLVRCLQSNRPTSVKLETLFPEQASTHNVVDPVYAGGPVLSRAVFAVTRKAPETMV